MHFGNYERIFAFSSSKDCCTYARMTSANYSYCRNVYGSNRNVRYPQWQKVLVRIHIHWIRTFYWPYGSGLGGHRSTLRKITIDFLGEKDSSIGAVYLEIKIY